MNNVTSLSDYKRRKAEKIADEFHKEYLAWRDWIKKENEACARKIAPIVFLRPPPDSAA